MTVDDFEIGEHNDNVTNTYVSKDSYHYNGNGLDFDFKYVITTHSYEEWDGYDYTRYAVYLAITKGNIHPIHRRSHRKEVRCNYDAMLYLMSFGIIIKEWHKQNIFSEKDLNKIIKAINPNKLDYQIKLHKRNEKFKGIIEGTDFPKTL